MKAKLSGAAAAQRCLAGDARLRAASGSDGGQAAGVRKPLSRPPDRTRSLKCTQAAARSVAEGGDRNSVALLPPETSGPPGPPASFRRTLRSAGSASETQAVILWCELPAKLQAPFFCTERRLYLLHFLGSTKVGGLLLIVLLPPPVPARLGLSSNRLPLSIISLRPKG